ncbi:MAG: hypothetical protein JSS83_22165 [Cyanobacteria bacterium SZAS LIN-3]|nr:hypothetical protein [Cyanobacteria bacterium SZAS LIN-3]MBS2005741.1 hypothetical protein [Cyanobacteria bacterium SZAS TMP-1]
MPISDIADSPKVNHDHQDNSQPHPSENSLFNRTWQMIADHPVLTGAVVGTAALIGARAGVGRLATAGVSAAEEAFFGRATVAAAKDPLIALADRPANIFDLLMKKEPELSTIAAHVAGKGEPLFTMADTTMSLSDPQKWKLLIEAGGHDFYNAEVLRLTNRWGTLMEDKMAQGVIFDRNAISSIPRSQMDDLLVSYGTVKHALLCNWKYADKFNWLGSGF